MRARTLFLALVPFAAGCEAAATAASEPPPEPARVVVAPVERRDVHERFTVPASVEPDERTVVRALEGGLLAALRVDLGDILEPGQVVAVVDAPRLRDEAAVLAARQAEAEAAVAEARAARKERALLRDRLAQVAARGQGLVPRHEVEAAEAAVDVAEARLRTARAHQGTVAASRKELETRTGFLEVRSPPYPSVVVRRLASPGALVGPGAPGGAGIVEVARRDAVRVAVVVPADRVADVKPGCKVALAEPGGNLVAEGAVDRTAGALDPGTRTLRAEVRLAGGSLVAGTYLRADVTAHTREGALVVPAAAVSRTGGAAVWRCASGQLERVPVETGVEDGATVEVTEGLGPDDAVVVSGVAGLAAGGACVAVVR